MKRFIPACLAAAIVFLGSCAKEDPMSSPSKYTNFGSKTELSNTRQSKEAQIDYIQKTCIDFLGEIEDIKTVIPMINDAFYQLDKSTDPEAYASFYEALLAAERNVEDGVYTGDELPSSVTSAPKFKKTVDYSALKGTFEISKDGKTMTASKSSDFCLISYGQEGNKYESRVAISPSSTVIYMSEYYDNADKSYYENYLVLPQRIDATVKRDGVVVLDAHLSVSTKSFEGAYINLAKSIVEVSGKVNANGMLLNIDKMKLAGNNSVELFANVSKNGNKLASVAGTFDFAFRNDMVMNPGASITVTDIKDVKNLDLSVNVLGRVQLKVKCKDVVNAVLLYTSEKDNTAELRKEVDAAIYFDNGSKKQAYLDFAFVAATEDSSAQIAPMINYGDAEGDSCMLFEYFNGENFSALIDAWKNFKGK